MSIDVSNVHTLLERYAEEVGGTFVANIFGQTRVFIVDADQVSPALPDSSHMMYSFISFRKSTPTHF